jgi:hypothetical protein
MHCVLRNACKLKAILKTTPGFNTSIPENAGIIGVESIAFNLVPACFARSFDQFAFSVDQYKLPDYPGIH